MYRSSTGHIVKYIGDIVKHRTLVITEKINLYKNIRYVDFKRMYKNILDILNSTALFLNLLNLHNLIQCTNRPNEIPILVILFSSKIIYKDH